MSNVRGRHTIRASTSSRSSRLISPWSLPEAEKGSSLARIEKAYFDALAAVDATELRRAEGKKGGVLTESGIKSDLLSFASKELAPNLRRAKIAIDQARREAEERRAALTLPVDKTDTYGLQRRAELRAYLRSLPEKERRDIGANFEKLDPETALAITEMPARLSGMMETDHARLVEQALKATHGEEIDRVNSLEEAVKVADIAVTAAREEIEQEVGGKAALDAAAREYEAQVNAPWLRKVAGGQVQTFHVNGRFATWRPATPEEEESGQFFKSADLWRAANGGGPLEEKTNGAG
jgi:hypothetical protein